MQRLARFTQAHPDIELDVLTGLGELDPRIDEARLAIQYRDPRIDADENPDLSVECLLSGRSYPVCRPDLIERHAVEQPRDLLNHTLLHGEDRGWWRWWFEAAGVPLEGELAGPLFSESYLAVLAAEAGQGVALLDDIEAADALAEGRLVYMMDFGIPAGEYVIVQNALMAETTVMKTVKEWLRGEAKAFARSHTRPANSRTASKRHG